MAGPTLRDVAAEAGVSIRTVSNVVSDYPYVADDTRARVQAAIDRLGYRPNLLARSLKQGRSHVIALVVPELDVPYFAELARLIIAEGRERGYLVMIDHTDGDKNLERELILQNARPMNFDGVILSPLALSGADLSERPPGAPILLLGEKSFDSLADHVAIDNVAAADEATTHLIDIGRSRIAAIGVQPSGYDTAKLRLKGFRRAHRRAGIPVDRSLLMTATRFHRTDGAEAMRQLLARPDRPDAVFCFNDLLALGAMRTVLAAGLRVPEDVAIVGFDDIEDGRFSTPTLTTISPDKQLIARQAIEQILTRISKSDDAAPIEIRAPFRLAIRESTAGIPCDGGARHQADRPASRPTRSDSQP
ncbi:LacI family DNA-binding transcriptional regulator [Actinoallomurus iriomotensis]|uniref:LacI family DNA-binding transcriptional regulator n=1 Tax=Actinoallomurus iriomotensis TaxID=478107 RepID=UPI0025563E9A|nr:LacI family DNA-binding transcriptional regulator [Actinoallomurus iriomotensis]